MRLSKDDIENGETLICRGCGEEADYLSDDALWCEACEEDELSQLTLRQRIHGERWDSFL